MSCTPGRCAVAARMERSIRHALFRNHEMSIKCAGCQEHMGFGTVEGYQGDVDYPICGDGMEVVLAREQERVTEAEAHQPTFPRFLHRLSHAEGHDEGRCSPDMPDGAIQEPSGGQGAPQSDSPQEDITPALPSGSYGDGLHHMHQCLACRLTFPCRVEHPPDPLLLVRDVVAMCPNRESY